MKAFLIFWLVIISAYTSFGQGENNVWMFGQNYSLDFNHTPPLLRDNVYLNSTPTGAAGQATMHPGQHRYNFAQAVCDASGNIRFMVKMYLSTQNGQPSPNLFDQNEVPIPGTDFLMTTDMQITRSLVVPHPGNGNQYYIFYVRDGGLIYCLFDMTLNGGRGDIVPGQKNRLAYAYNTIVAERMTTIQGCDGVWIVAKHKLNNQYLSFKIDHNGINQIPVISAVAQLSPLEYNSTKVELVASPNGKMLATASLVMANNGFIGGIEIYDFEKCSGRLKNARLFEQGNYIYGVGFSPDGSKLYAAYSEYNPLLTPIASSLRDHNLYQFDLTASTIGPIVASKTLIFTNPSVQANDNFCPLRTPYLGSMRIGKNGKLYLTNGAPEICAGTSGVGLALHIINDPNLPGMACNPILNTVFNTINGMSYDYSHYKVNLPYEIIRAPDNLPHSIINPTTALSVCFKDEAVLKAPVNATCITWSDSSNDTILQVTESGKYWIRYFKDCTTYTDTFEVEFISLPKIDRVQYGCSGYINLIAGEPNGQAFEMELYNAQGGKIYGGNNESQHIIHNLYEENYLLKIKSKNCDTTIIVELKAYPNAEITIEPEIAHINLGDEIELTATGGFNYSWTPASSLNVRTEGRVIASPDEHTRYSVIAVNEYGCRDTAFATVNVGFNKKIRMPNAFTPNNDGLNDLFAIPEGKWQILKFEVYNRFGQMVYRKDDHSAGWNGTFKGQTCDAGIYFYSIILSMPDKTNFTLSGDVHLMR
ncbi:MAG: gliding motility-associated C-terminal domain-containing protein [Taibaiella sp.]|nr:gliding motility-associated C-terminal domain-containing protein [Taibaiella sp.]